MIIDVAGINFPITIDLQNSQLSGTIPSELVVRELRTEIDKYDGYMIKDTGFNRWRLNNIDLGNLTSGGVEVKLSLNLKHREKLASLFGKTYWSPWVSVTLHGSAEFAVSIKDNIIDVSYRSHNLRGQKWYADIVSLLANDLLKHQIASALRKGLSRFSGLSIISFLKEGKVINTEGMNIPIDTLLTNVSASANIVSSGISFVVKIPSTVILT